MKNNGMNLSRETKMNLRDKFENACEAYRHTLEKMWELNPVDGYWIGDEVGGLYDNGGYVTIGLLDMVYCIENGITLVEFLKWSDYCTDADEFGFSLLNLRAWHLGAPRVPDSTFEKLRKMKKEFVDFAEQERGKF